MAFTLIIKKAGLFNKEGVFSFDDLIRNCDLEYGSADPFYVLKHHQKLDQTCVLYNPHRIGRGIRFDERKAEKGIIEISHSIPTTGTEIRDFLRIVKEIEKQFVKATFYCKEEKRYYKMRELEEKADKMVVFCLDKLHEIAHDESLLQLVFIAKYPWFVSEEKREKYKTCTTLFDYEQTMHVLQTEDVYYPSPKILQHPETKKITAIYTCPDECVSVFQLEPKLLFSIYKLNVDQILVRFLSISKKDFIGEFYSYDKFIEYQLQKNVKYFDAKTICVMPMTEEQIREMITCIE